MRTKRILRFIQVMSILMISLSACTSMADASMLAVGGLSSQIPGLQQVISVSAADSPQAATGCFDGGCHASLKEQQAAFVHTAFEQEQCLSCHTSDHTDPVLTPEMSIQLCYTCHVPDSFGYTHPLGEGVINPVTGEMVTCLSCHGHHSADNSAVLLLDGRGSLCVSCHTEFLSAE